MTRAITFLLMLGVLILSRDCLAASHDYGIPESQNLLGNGSFEGEGYWLARPVKSGEGVFHAVRDWQFPHVVSLPYWEGKATYYRPIHGDRYMELGWDGQANPDSGGNAVSQEVSIPSPGKYLMIAHVRAHVGIVEGENAGLPNASVSLIDSSDGVVLRRVNIDWLPARQNWILVAALVDIKGARVSLRLGFDEDETATRKTASKDLKENFSYLFDDVRLVAVGGASQDVIHRFEEKSRLNLSTKETDSRPLYEYEYADDGFADRKFSSQKISFPFLSDSAWEYKASGAAKILTDQNLNGEKIIVASVTNERSESPAEIVRDVSLPSSAVGNKRFVSVSAWVWSDAPRSAYIRLEYDGDKSAESAFHSGSGKWEYLTVVAPYSITGEKLRLALRLNTGEARFRSPDLLIVADDRFDGILPPQDIGGGRLRERISYKKNLNRYRIVVVGNSTVNGVAFVAHHASFPYLLQLKLETLYPGKFEVINYGIGAGGLLDQIVSIKHHFKFATSDNNYYLPLINPARYETPSSTSLVNAAHDAVSLAALKPDVIIIGSMWNDLDRLFNWHVMERDYGAMDEFLALLDNPSPAANNVYRQKKKAILDQIDGKRAGLNPRNYSYAWNSEQGYAELSRDGQFYASARKAEKKYEELLEAFVARAAKVADVWSLALPANGGNKAAILFDRFPDVLLKADGMEKEKKKAIAFYRQVSAGIQSRASRDIALKHRIPSLDLVSSYDANIEDADAGEWAKLDYFVPDLLHFTYRGNQWIADEIFRLMEVEFDRMAKKIN